MKKRILLSWIGHTDLKLMESEVGGEVAALINKTIPHWAKRGESSPIRAIVDNEAFDHIYLLSNYGPELDQAFGKWLARPFTIHSCEVPDPSDYTHIFSVTKDALDRISAEYGGERLFINLSSGTHTMVANLLLLGSTFYSATFFTSYQAKPTIVSLPFNLELTLRDQFDQTWASLPFKSPSGFEHIHGGDKSLINAIQRAKHAATHHVSVLLLGESGVGKELFAKAIHNASGRKGRFEAVNCAAIPSELFDSEMFGSKKGAYTGGDRDRPGHFMQANQGTLFLDELGELSPLHQAKLLRAVQPSGTPPKLTLEKVGDPGNPYTVDVQIVCATNRNLTDPKAANQFRHDLFHRLSIFPIRIPSLRGRRNDIPLLAEKLLVEINETFKSRTPSYESKTLTGGALQRLKQHEWPGNIRELKSVLTRAAAVSDHLNLNKADIDQEIIGMDVVEEPNVFSQTRETGFKLDERLDLIQKTFIEDALDEVGGTQSKAADLLGINYLTLNRRIRSLKIRVVKTAR